MAEKKKIHTERNAQNAEVEKLWKSQTSKPLEVRQIIIQKKKINHHKTNQKKPQNKHAAVECVERGCRRSHLTAPSAGAHRCSSRRAAPGGDRRRRALCCPLAAVDPTRYGARHALSPRRQTPPSVRRSCRLVRLGAPPACWCQVPADPGRSPSRAQACHPASRLRRREWRDDLFVCCFTS